MKKTEPYFFLIFTIVSILPFFLVKYVPSLDGPQHLYASRLVNELLSGDDFISRFYRFNPVIVGNQTSLYVMALLMFVFPAWISEKIFLSLYLIGMALSFRYFVRSITKDSSLLYMLIFPLTFTHLFFIGYYNFSVAFIPFFITLGYFKRHENRLGIFQVFWLAVFSLLIYLTHAVVFVFFGFIIFLQMIFDLVYPLFMHTASSKGIFSTLKRYSLVLITSIPSIILWILYYLSLNGGDHSITAVSFTPLTQSLHDLYRLRALTGFHAAMEAGSNALLFWTLVGLILLVIIPLQRYFKFIKQPDREKVKDPDWAKWTFISIILLLISVFSPDRMVTGNMAIRIYILFFFVLITWVGIQSYSKFFTTLSLLTILAAFIWHRSVILHFYKELNKEIAEIEQVGKYVEPNSIIFPVNCSENWLQPHFHCYLGVDKPIVDLRNPQANGPMPLIWNYTKMPNMLLGKLDQKQAGAHWDYGNNYLKPVPINYVFVWRAKREKLVEGVPELLDRIGPYYQEAFTSERGDALLLTLKSGQQQ